MHCARVCTRAGENGSVTTRAGRADTRGAHSRGYRCLCTVPPNAPPSASTCHLGPYSHRRCESSGDGVGMAPLVRACEQEAGHVTLESHGKASRRVEAVFRTA